MNDQLQWMEALSPIAGEEDPLVLFSSADADPPPGEFGVDIRDLDDFWPLAEALERRASRPGPVVVFTDVAANPAARSLAAATTARLLAESNRRVLLVDGDFAEPGLGPKLGTEDEEGLVDLMLYGASVNATCRKSGMKGVDLLSVGSFRPDSLEDFDDDALHRGFAQLRASYDLVLLCTGALTPDDRYHTFLVHADGIVLAPSGDLTDPTAATELLEYLQGQVLPVWGAVAFISADEARDRAVGALAPHDAPRVHHIDGESSSPFFRRLTLGLGLLLVVFLAWWGGTQLLAGRDDAKGPAELAARAARQTPTPSTPTSSAPLDETLDAEEAIEGASEDLKDSPPTAAADPATEALEGSTQADADVVQEDRTDQATEEPRREDTPPPRTSTADASGSATTPAEPAAASEDEDPHESLIAAAKLTPRNGWALHLWSFPDSTEAVVAGRKLRPDGYSPLVVSAQIEGKGTWYRVLVGRFGSRADAMEARSILGQRPDVEYVGVVRVP